MEETSQQRVNDSSGLIGAIAAAAGAPEPAIRLLLTIFAGYPVAAFYRRVLVQHKSKSVHHIFFATIGLLLCFFNYGYDTYHSLITVLITYGLVRLMRFAPQAFLALNFIFNLGYLLLGYYFTESGDYDILWTMPQCVLTLRMIGFGFDIADGCKDPSQLSKEQQENALNKTPSLLEILAFSYFPCSFLVGPQFPFARYQHFINGDYEKHDGSLKAGMKRFLLGLLYLLMRQIGAMLLPDDYFLTDEYYNQSFAWRLIQLGFWGKFALYKYISCWLLTEGALMAIGLSYLPSTSTKSERSDDSNNWYGCSNVKLIHLELGHTMQDYVIAFNVNTNQWVAQYIYKRLKFLNNRTISYAAALSFLAVWHGFHSGYYMAFIMEYMIVTIEKNIEEMYTQAILPRYGHILNKSLLYKCLMEAVLKTYNLIYMGWCLTSFIFLNYSRWSRVFAAVNYFGFIYMAFWFVFYRVYKYNQKINRKLQKGKEINHETSIRHTKNE